MFLFIDCSRPWNIRKVADNRPWNKQSNNDEKTFAHIDSTENVNITLD